MILLLIGCKTQDTYNDAIDGVKELALENDDNSLKMDDNTETEFKNDNNNTSNEKNISVDNSNNEKVAELINGDSLYYGEKGSIFIESEDNIIVLNDYYSSYPELSPNNKLIAYIDGIGNEFVSNLFIYDIETKENIQKTNYDYSQSNTVKVSEWIDDSRVFMIIGFAFGTVSQGGDL